MDQNSVFIVSGGGRGITAKCIIKLAQFCPCRFILMGRSKLENEPQWANDIIDEIELKKRAFSALNSQGKKPKPQEINQIIKTIFANREIQETLADIRQLGGKAEYLSCDITNNNDLSENLAPLVNQFGKITGVIHGAGVLADKLIENKTLADFERVYSTKIDGLFNLLNCVDYSQLKHLILFSSVAGFYGNIGQSDYAIANEILNKFAHQFKHQYPKCKVISFNWGPWESGMVTAQLKEIFAQRGIEVISVNVGTKVFVNEILKNQNEQVQILVGRGLFDANIELKSELETHSFRRKLTLSANPFLQDHVIGNRPVLPAVFATIWLANTAEQIYPGYKFFSCDNFKVLKGIVFDETLTDEYVLDIKEISKIPEQEIKLFATIWSQTNEGKPRYHYQSHLKLFKQIPEKPIYKKFDYKQDEKLINLSPYKDRILFHGSSFQGVKRVLNANNKKITLECIFPQVKSSHFGQFPAQAFNPLSLDAAFQCMLIWVRKFYDSGSLPSNCQKGEYYQDIPLGKIFYASMEVKSNSNTKLIANIYLHDKNGNIYSQVFEAEVTISKQLNYLFVSAKNHSS